MDGGGGSLTRKSLVVVCFSILVCFAFEQWRLQVIFLLPFLFMYFTYIGACLIAQHRVPSLPTAASRGQGIGAVGSFFLWVLEIEPGHLCLTYGPPLQPHFLISSLSLLSSTSVCSIILPQSLKCWDYRGPELDF
ncbi:hypothetical protein ACRRTK_006199 [Alexandromys fortis]